MEKRGAASRTRKEKGRPAVGKHVYLECFLRFTDKAGEAIADKVRAAAAMYMAVWSPVVGTFSSLSLIHI